MSTVTKLDCVICNPEAGDKGGIRRPVTVTSQELSTLIMHTIKEHAPKPEFIPVENKALDEIAPVVVAVNVAPVDVTPVVVAPVVSGNAQEN